jgi:hypothetical protein
MKARISWDGTDLTAIVEVENEAEAFGLCGDFFFEQGGHGKMGFPVDVQVIR